MSSADGGKTWDITYNSFGFLQPIVFVNDHEGFYLSSLRSGGNIYKTTDCGNKWSIVYQNNYDSTGYIFSGNDICFNNEKVGWSAGSYNLDTTGGAAVLKIEDEGLNWELEWKYQNSNEYRYALNSIYASETTAWAAGEYGMVVKYTPQTGWKEQTSITDLPLYKVFFLNDNYGWISGGYYNDNNFKSILLKTTNGGESWETRNLDYLINDIWFANNQHGWSVGSDKSGKGIILETEDGGDNWIIVVDSLIGPLNSVFVKNNYAWAVGRYGLVLRTTNLGVTWIDDDNNKVYPTEFKLEQNYPNPFNPTTEIGFRIVDFGLVTLKVYDVLGREVATLVNEYKPAGIYEVEFNAVETHRDASLPSGVYFYRLTSGSYTATKKMLFLK